MAADRRNLRPNLKETKNVQHFYEPIESLSHTYTAHLRIVEVTVDHGHWDLCQHDGVGEGEGEDQEIGRLAEERGPGKKRKALNFIADIFALTFAIRDWCTQDLK